MQKTPQAGRPFFRDTLGQKARRDTRERRKKTQSQEKKDASVAFDSIPTSKPTLQQSSLQQPTGQWGKKLKNSSSSTPTTTVGDTAHTDTQHLQTCRAGFLGNSKGKTRKKLIADFPDNFLATQAIEKQPLYTAPLQ
jgi:hypothetical protein